MIGLTMLGVVQHERSDNAYSYSQPLSSLRLCSVLNAYMPNSTYGLETNHTVEAMN
jgi:hypothetical protein